MHGLSVWRLPEYYVYPNSTSILELGTRANPYKNINLVMIEMFNLLSNMNITTKIKLAKSSTYHLDNYNSIISNMKDVIIEPYDTSLKYSSNSEYGIKLKKRKTNLSIDYTTRTLINFTNNGTLFSLMKNSCQCFKPDNKICNIIIYILQHKSVFRT